MPIITLTSDYGLSDPYAASVKGTILSELSEVTLVDITHNINPGNFFEAAFILRNSYYTFPKGTVHLISVQEITKNNRWLAAEMDGHYFVAADNGIITTINPEIKIKRLVEINLKQEAGMFPSRNLLARSACHLARGGNIDFLGRELKEYKESSIMRPRIAKDGSNILGSVVYVDNFGNLITNISRKTFREVGKERPFEIVLPRNKAIEKLHESYYPASLGSVLALFNSQNLLEIALSGAQGKDYNGANSLLGLDVRDTVTVNFK